MTTTTIFVKDPGFVEISTSCIQRHIHITCALFSGRVMQGGTNPAIYDWQHPDMVVKIIMHSKVGLISVLCHEAKMTHFPNGHYEGPIDFFDQPF